MFDYNKRKIPKNESILETEKYMYHEDKEDIKFESEDGLKVDYVRKPAPVNGPVAFVCGFLGILFLIISVIIMNNSAGKPPKVTAALVFSSIVWALAAIGFGIQSLTEKDRNYNLSYMALGTGAVILVVCAVTIVLCNR